MVLMLVDFNVVFLSGLDFSLMLFCVGCLVMVCFAPWIPECVMCY